MLLELLLLAVVFLAQQIHNFLGYVIPAEWFQIFSNNIASWYEVMVIFMDNFLDGRVMVAISVMVNIASVIYAWKLLERGIKRVVSFVR